MTCRGGDVATAFNRPASSSLRATEYIPNRSLWLESRRDPTPRPVVSRSPTAAKPQVDGRLCRLNGLKGLYEPVVPPRTTVLS